MRRVLEYARGIGRPVIAHCEDLNAARLGRVHEGAHATCCGLPGSPAEAETAMVARDLELARLTGAHLHVAHVSAAALGRADPRGEGARRARHRRGDAAPPRAHRRGDAAATTRTFKMAPPLRSARDREALREGLARRHASTASRPTTRRTRCTRRTSSSPRRRSASSASRPRSRSRSSWCARSA